MANCGKLLESWEYQTILPVSWETCRWFKKQQLEPCMEQLIASKEHRESIEKGVWQGSLLSPCLFNLYERIMRNAGLDVLQAGIKIGGRNINNLRYAVDATLMTERKEQLNNLLMRVKEECERAGLKLNIKQNYDHGIWPHCFMEIEGKRWCSDRFPLLGLQNNCGWWLQPWDQKMIASWQESHDKPRQCVKKQRHYSAEKVPIVKAMVLPLVMYGSDSWTLKKAGHQRIDAFDLWCWRRLLRVPWTQGDQTSQS